MAEEQQQRLSVRSSRNEYERLMLAIREPPLPKPWVLRRIKWPEDKPLPALQVFEDDTSDSDSEPLPDEKQRLPSVISLPRVLQKTLKMQKKENPSVTAKALPEEAWHLEPQPSAAIQEHLRALVLQQLSRLEAGDAPVTRRHQVMAQATAEAHAFLVQYLGYLSSLREYRAKTPNEVKRQRRRMASERGNFDTALHAMMLMKLPEELVKRINERVAPLMERFAVPISKRRKEMRENEEGEETEEGEPYKDEEEEEEAEEEGDDDDDDDDDEEDQGEDVADPGNEDDEAIKEATEKRKRRRTK